MIIPRAGHDAARRCAARCPRGRRGRAACSAAGVDVLTVDEAKGLEFDSVMVVEPAGRWSTSRRAAVNDLYVALTRPTQRLHVVLHPGALPPGLDRLLD